MIVLNGAIGADLHIPFPIAARASYGYWLSYFCVISRGILALFWFGIQGAFGASCITPVSIAVTHVYWNYARADKIHQQIITAIWPSYTNIPNYLPASAGITTQGMVSYFLYNLIQFPCLLIPTHRLQLMFWIKSVLVPPTALAMVIWISVTAGGGGNFFNEPATVQGSQRAWLWLSSLTSMTGGFSTLAVNIPDFSRFNKTPGAQVWQFPFIPIFKVLVALLGIVSASASQQLYGQTLWSPIDIINQWQGSPGGRAAAFFCALVWLLAQICVNISSNSISFANGMPLMHLRLLSLLTKFKTLRVWYPNTSTSGVASSSRPSSVAGPCVRGSSPALQSHFSCSCQHTPSSWVPSPESWYATTGWSSVASTMFRIFTTLQVSTTTTTGASTGGLSLSTSSSLRLCSRAWLTR